MIDASQILIIAAVTVMTVVLTIIGVQLIFVLRDLRFLLTKINSVVAEFEKVGLNVGKGYEEVVGFISGMKKLLFIADLISRKKKGKKNEDK